MAIQNLSQVTQLSLGILLLYMAFNSCSNLQSSLLENDGFGPLGFYTLACLYFFMGIGSLMSTAIMNKIGTKGCLMAGGIGNVIWMLSNLLVAIRQENGDMGIPFWLMVAIIFLGTIANGFTVGFMWAAANQYVADCAPHHYEGFFFSYFWSFYMASQIFGNIIAAFALGYLS